MANARFVRLGPLLVAVVVCAPAITGCAWFSPDGTAATTDENQPALARLLAEIMRQESDLDAQHNALSRIRDDLDHQLTVTRAAQPLAESEIDELQQRIRDAAGPPEAASAGGEAESLAAQASAFYEATYEPLLPGSPADDAYATTYGSGSTTEFDATAFSAAWHASVRSHARLVIATDDFARCQGQPAQFAGATTARRYGPDLPACLRALDSLSGAQFVQRRGQLVELLEHSSAEVSSSIEALDQSRNDRRAAREAVEKSMSREPAANSLIRYCLPLMGIIVVAMFLAGVAPRWFGQRQSADLERTVVQIATVLLLISAIVMLGLAGRIESEVLGTLIGGIAGYVLGNQGRTRRRADADERTDDGNGRNEPRPSMASQQAAPKATSPAASGGLTVAGGAPASVATTVTPQSGPAPSEDGDDQ